MKPETTMEFERLAQEAIESAGCVPCESVEEFRLGLAIMVSMIKDRIKELGGC